tara:strand:+ start:252 stop:530 length:279 start_codon:yes stop_codon:yes gene_type:complete
MFNSFNVGNGPVQFGTMVDAPSPPDYQSPNGLGSVLGSTRMSFGLPKPVKIVLPAGLMAYSMLRIYNSPQDWKMLSAGIIAMGALTLAGVQS